MAEISNNDNTIDSRDVIERIERLEEEREPLQEAVDEAKTAIKDLEEERVHYKDADDLADIQKRLDEAKEDLKTQEQELEEWDESDEAEELKALQDFAEVCSDNREWKHGMTLINHSHFEDYARELAKDIGAISGEEKWPCTCIDWEQAAEELRIDYTEYVFGDVPFYANS